MYLNFKVNTSYFLEFHKSNPVIYINVIVTCFSASGSNKFKTQLSQKENERTRHTLRVNENS